MNKQTVINILQEMSKTGFKNIGFSVFKATNYIIRIKGTGLFITIKDNSFSISAMNDYLDADGYYFIKQKFNNIFKKHVIKEIENVCKYSL